jgi:hypothetical protein
MLLDTRCLYSAPPSMALSSAEGSWPGLKMGMRSSMFRGRGRITRVVMLLVLLQVYPPFSERHAWPRWADHMRWQSMPERVGALPRLAQCRNRAPVPRTYGNDVAGRLWTGLAPARSDNVSVHGVLMHCCEQALHGRGQRTGCFSQAGDYFNNRTQGRTQEAVYVSSLHM